MFSYLYIRIIIDTLSQIMCLITFASDDYSESKIKCQLSLNNILV